MTKILLVEDDKSLREIYGVRLYAEGYDIVSAGDGEEALAMAIKERPDLIVSDVMMPKISGFDMLDILRSTTETKNIKVIMMTALSSEDQRARGESLGADRYLVKSQVGIEDVVRTVHEVLGDAPTAQPSAAQTFATPAPSALPRTEVAERPQAPAYPSAAPDPTPPAFTPQPAPAPQVQPPQPQMQQQAPVQPAPSPNPGALPLPTAPFSTPRPANLGDRIINPIPQQESDKQDFASMMSQELDMATITPSAQPEPAATPSAAVEESASQVADAPQEQLAPQYNPFEQQPADAAPVFTLPTQATPSVFSQPESMHGAINFEETPLPSTNTSPQVAPVAPPNTNNAA